MALFKQRQIHLDVIGKKHQVGVARFLRRKQLHVLRLLHHDDLAEGGEPVVALREVLDAVHKIRDVEILKLVLRDVRIDARTLHPDETDVRVRLREIQHGAHKFFRAAHAFCPPHHRHLCAASHSTIVTGLPPTVTGLPSKSSLHSLFSM